jgi:hypothetical protein
VIAGNQKALRQYAVFLALSQWHRPADFGRLLSMAIHRDDELAAVIGQVPGIKVTHHYRGRPPHAENYYIHLAVEDDAALHRLCQLAARVNAPLQVYEQSETELRYTLIVNDYSRKILMSAD